MSRGQLENFSSCISKYFSVTHHTYLEIIEKNTTDIGINLEFNVLSNKKLYYLLLKYQTLNSNSSLANLDKAIVIAECYGKCSGYLKFV